MTNSANNQRIEENFHTFSEKYIELFADIKKGLEAMGSFHIEHINALQSIIKALEATNYSKAREYLTNADMSSLLEESFENNLKLNSDLDSLRIRMTNLNLLETELSNPA
ncbi:MAG: hypothetical protein GX029_03585 [Pseudomonadaceae bacterium]|nr:hypothetical protein [Pseudomonadaceae bacterium]